MSGIFEVLRERVNLLEIVGANAGEKVRCVRPSHHGTTPSMQAHDEDHVHCFSCGFSGDVTDM